jgi:hypothetical protein
LLGGIATAIVLWVGGMGVVGGRITLGELVAFQIYLGMLLWPMIAFGWVTNILQRGMASWKRMLEVLDAAPEIDDRAVSPAGRAVIIRGAIEIRDLTFSYPTSSTPALDHVSLRIEAGETAAFVGATGSGKSTLISLLPRLHEPPPGAVFLDGVDVREIPLASLRAAIGFVPQEPFLFSDTIAENIAFGVQSWASRERTATMRRCDRAHPCRGGSCAAGQGCRDVSQGLRHPRRRAGHHAVGRAEAADGHRPRPDGGSTGARPRRCAVGGGYLHGGGDPRASSRRDAAAHVAHRRTASRPSATLIASPRALDRGASPSRAADW